MLKLDTLREKSPFPVATAVLLSSTLLSLPQGNVTAVPGSKTVAVQSFKDDLKEYAVERALARRVAAQMQAAENSRKEAIEAKQKAPAEWKTVSRPATPNRGTDSGKDINVGALLSYAFSLKSVPYLYGGTDPNRGLDCSSYTQVVFRQFGLELPRTSYLQFRLGVGIARSALEPGDLVFFSTNGSGASHVGIYIGKGEFISETSRGVRVNNLDEAYWNQNYRGSRRVIGVELSQ